MTKTSNPAIDSCRICKYFFQRSIAFFLSPDSPASADGYIAAYDNDKQAAYHIYYHATFKLRTSSLHMLIGHCVECLCLAYEQAPLSEFAGFY